MAHRSLRDDYGSELLGDLLCMPRPDTDAGTLIERSLSADPAFKIAAVDDTEYQVDAVLVDNVVHDAVLTHAKAVEGVMHSLDRLDRLAADAARRRGIAG